MVTTHSETIPENRYHLGSKTDWRDLIDHQTSMSGSTTMEEAQNFFRSHPDCHFGVVLDEDNQIIGLCSEQKIGNTLSQWGLGYAVFAKKPVRNHILEDDYRIVSGSPVYQVLSAIMKRQEDFFDDVILIDQQGKFLGLIRVATLVHLQHEINRQQYEEIKNFTEQLNRSNEELASARDTAMQAAEMKSSFLANMSHEIRTPLNGILGMVKILLRTPLSATQRRYAQTVQNSGSALLTILNDILDFSKIEAGKMELEQTPFDIAEVMDEVVELMEERAREKNIELFSWINSNSTTHVISDPARIRQVLLNLISNAIKFTEQGEVLVRVTQQEETQETVTLKISVRDTGIGISPENQQKLFQAFQQADSSTNRKFGGTGLGLAISRKLVELLGGQISLESMEGKGSNFFFTINFKKQNPSDEITNHHVGEPDFWGVRNLIVTENTGYAGYLREQMTSWNIISRHVTSCEQAMDFIVSQADRSTPMDIIFIDTKVGNQSALDFAASVRANPAISDSRIVILANQDEEPDHHLTRELRITEILAKPLKSEALKNAISLALVHKPKSETRILPPAPVETSQAVPATETLHQDESPESSVPPLKLLLVEDSEVNREVALIQLQVWNHQIQTAENGKIALEILATETFDGILMDCQMPEVDGYEATAQIRNPESEILNHDVYIIAMTANALQGDREKCLQAGMNDYVSKPVDEAELLEALQRCADHSRNITPAADTEDTEVSMGPPAPPAPPANHATGFPPHLISLFINETERRLQELETHLGHEALDEAARAAHTIKGTAGNFKADTLADLARDIENCCVHHDIQRARDLLPSIWNTFNLHRQSLAVTA